MQSIEEKARAAYQKRKEAANRIITCPSEKCGYSINQDPFPRSYTCKDCRTIFCGHCGQKKLGNQTHIHSDLTCEGARSVTLGLSGDVYGLYYCQECVDFSKESFCKTCGIRLERMTIDGTSRLPSYYPTLALPPSVQFAEIFFAEERKKAHFLFVLREAGHYYFESSLYYFQIPTTEKIIKVELRPFPGTFFRIPKQLNFTTKFRGSRQTIEMKGKFDLGPEPTHSYRRFYGYFLFHGESQILAISDAILLTLGARTAQIHPRLSLIKMNVQMRKEAIKKEMEESPALSKSLDEMNISSAKQTDGEITRDDIEPDIKVLTLDELGTHLSEIEKKLEESFQESDRALVLDFLFLTDWAFIQQFLIGLTSGKYEENFKKFVVAFEKQKSDMENEQTTEYRSAWLLVLKHYINFSRMTPPSKRLRVKD